LLLFCLDPQVIVLDQSVDLQHLSSPASSSSQSLQLRTLILSGDRAIPMSTSRTSTAANGSLIETSQLEELRARLTDAQAAETAASNALTAFDTSGDRDGTSFSGLMGEARAARERTTIAYEAWSRAVAAFNKAPSEHGALGGQPALANQQVGPSAEVVLTRSATAASVARRPE
jgi:hypothetical protein